MKLREGGEKSRQNRHGFSLGTQLRHSGCIRCKSEARLNVSTLPSTSYLPHLFD